MKKKGNAAVRSGKMSKRAWRYRLCILIGILGILDTIFVLGMQGGINVGTVLPGLAGSILLLWGLGGEWIRREILKERFLLLRRLIMVGLVLLLSSFLVIEGLILANTEDPIPEGVETMIILGAGLNGDQLSWTLYERVHKGAEILKDNPQMKVVVTGGQGPGEWLPEGVAMARYLIEQGIPEERIIVEDKATSTMENFLYSRELLLQDSTFDPAKPLLVITSDFHMFRSKFLAKGNELNPIGVPCYTPWYIRPNVYLREYFAVVKSVLFDV